MNSVKPFGSGKLLKEMDYTRTVPGSSCLTASTVGRNAWLSLVLINGNGTQRVVADRSVLVSSFLR